MCAINERRDKQERKVGGKMKREGKGGEMMIERGRKGERENDRKGKKGERKNDRKGNKRRERR